MNKIYYLSTCDTCKKILKTLEGKAVFELIDIGKEGISEENLNEMYQLTGSYEKLFSKRAQLYKQRGLKDVALKEEDFRALILEHYTFLSRPVVFFDGDIFVGNSPKEQKRLQESFNKS